MDRARLIVLTPDGFHSPMESLRTTALAVMPRNRAEKVSRTLEHGGILPDCPKNNRNAKSLILRTYNALANHWFVTCSSMPDFLTLCFSRITISPSARKSDLLYSFLVSSA